VIPCISQIMCHDSHLDPGFNFASTRSKQHANFVCFVRHCILLPKGDWKYYVTSHHITTCLSVSSSSGPGDSIKNISRLTASAGEPRNKDRANGGMHPACRAQLSASSPRQHSLNTIPIFYKCAIRDFILHS
jgi:hypothetical protein